MFRRRLSTNLCLLLIVMIGYVHELDAQVSIKERVAINPTDGNGGQRNTVLDVPDIYWIAPRNGVVQLEVNRVTRILAPTPDTAYVRIKHGSIIDTTNAWQYFNASNQTNASDSNLCNHTKETVPWYWDGNATGNPQKLFFLNVSVGDTLRFWYQAGLNNPTTNITYDQNDSVWTVEMRSASCYKFYSDQEYCACYLKYADTAFCGFQVWMNDTIFYGNSTIARAVAVNSRGKEVPLEGSILLKYISTPSLYGRFVRAPGDTEVSPLLNVRYDYARNGNIQYVATNSVSDSIHSITITVKDIADTTKTGSGIVVVKRKLNWLRMLQGNSAWGDSIYDKYIDTIIINGSQRDTVWFKVRRKGCNLTCAAMIMYAFGIEEIDPGKLNALLKSNSGYNGPGVAYGAISEYEGNNSVEFYREFGKGLPNVYDITKIDQFLNNDNYGVMTQVLNPSTGKNHWVVVTSKSGGQYNILEPGNYNRTTLQAYSNTIYEMVVFRRKK